MKHAYKKIIGGAVAASLALSALTSAQVFGATLNVPGKPITLKVAPISISGYMYAGMRDVFSSIGCTVDWDNAAKTATAANAKTKLNAVFTLGSDTAEINGADVRMPGPAQIVGGSLMIPISVIGDVYNQKALWNAADSSIVLEPLPENITVLKSAGFVTDKTEVIAYADALSKVIDTSGVIKTIDSNLDTTKRLRNTMGINASTDMSYLAANTRQMKSYDIQISDADYNKQIARDQQEQKLRAQLTTILGSAMDIQSAQDSIRVANLNLTNLKIQGQLGMVAAVDIVTAQQALDKSQQSLDQAQLNLKSQRQALNQMMGLKFDADIVVDFAPDIQPLKGSVDSYVSTALSSDISMKMAQEQRDLAQYIYNTYDSSLDNSWQESHNKYDQAMKTYNDARTAMEKAVRSAYNAIQQQDAAMKVNDITLQTAKDAYNKALINYSVGSTTFYDVENSKLGVLSAEIAIEKANYAMSNQLFTFARPYLLTAG